MSNIYLIRHGQASFFSDQYDQLSDLGRMQSKILGDYLAQAGITFDAVYSGSLLRQKDTGELVLGRMGRRVTRDLRIDPGLNEYDAQGIVTSQIPGMLREDPSLGRDVKRMNERRSFQRVFEGAMRRWVSGRYDVEDVETWKDFTSRVWGAIGEVMVENGRGKRIALFTSGGPISVTVQKALGVSDEVTLQLCWQLRNASISGFKYNHKGIMLSGFNGTYHLESRNEPHLLTYR